MTLLTAVSFQTNPNRNHHHLNGYRLQKKEKQKLQIQKRVITSVLESVFFLPFPIINATQNASEAASNLKHKRGNGFFMVSYRGNEDKR